MNGAETQLVFGCASHKYDRIEIIEFSHPRLKHDFYGYIGLEQSSTIVTKDWLLNNSI